jgi:hypothetical protein
MSSALSFLRRTYVNSSFSHHYSRAGTEDLPALADVRHLTGAAYPVSVSLFSAAELSDGPASVQVQVSPIKMDENNEYRRGLLLGWLCAAFT